MPMTESDYATLLAQDAKRIASARRLKMGGLPVWSGGQATTAEDNASRCLVAIRGGVTTQRALFNRLHLSPNAVADATQRLLAEGLIITRRGVKGRILYEAVA